MDTKTGNNNINTTGEEYKVWRTGRRLKAWNIVVASSALQARKRESERLGIPVTELAAMRYQRT